MSKFSRLAPIVKVYLNQELRTDLIPITIEHSHGGHRMDHAQLRCDLGVTNRRGKADIVDRVLGEDFSAKVSSGGVECEIVATINGAEEVWHWGHLSREEISIDDKSVKLDLISRFEKSLFGKPITYQRVREPYIGSESWGSPSGERGVYIDQEIVFNPELSGAIRGNMRTRQSTNLKYPIFIHPDSVLTQHAADYQNAGFRNIEDIDFVHEAAADNWDLASAVLYCCGECNADEAHVKNPIPSDLALLFPLGAGGKPSKTVLKNAKVHAGHYLPDVLDALLEPYGYSWRVDYIARGKRQIKIYQLGVGKGLTVLFQRPKDVLDLTKQNVERLDLDFDLAGTVNQVRVDGDFTAVELTIELAPAWDPSQDGTDLELLDKNEEDWDTPAKTPLHRVGRDWVANEAGDYGRSAPLDLTAAFRAAFGADHPPLVARRRKFEPTLTRDSDGSKPIGRHGGLVVEWFNLDAEGGAGWEAIPTGEADWHFRILDKEMGIAFGADIPPLEIWDDMAHARVRVTGTVKSDTRLSYTAERTDNSVSAETVEHIVDKSKSFHFKKLVRTGFYASKFAGQVDAKTLTAKEADGRVALQEYATHLRDTWDQAELSGTIILEGLDRTASATTSGGRYQIGDCITKVSGRSILFEINRRAKNPRYPQIVAVRRHIQDQSTALLLHSFREVDDYIGGMLRKVRSLK